MRLSISVGLVIALFAGVSAMSGCAYYDREPLAEGKSRAGLVSRAVPEFYIVARGDTLYSIAWRYGLDFRTLATRNGLVHPYRIYAGSRLRLRTRMTNDTVTASEPLARRGNASERPRRIGDPSTNHRHDMLAGHGERLHASGVDWHWPVRGQVTAPPANSEKFGVEILGTDGTAIRAAAPGEVVYSGDRLIGYGKLIIIRHNDAFLSAYGYNSRLLVTEGLRVAAGQEIAEMGHSGTDQAKLYFEIRRNGKPVPPLDYLP